MDIFPAQFLVHVSIKHIAFWAQHCLITEIKLFRNSYIQGQGSVQLLEGIRKESPKHVYLFADCCCCLCTLFILYLITLSLFHMTQR
jgi:hypothetical protein